MGRRWINSSFKMGALKRDGRSKSGNALRRAAVSAIELLETRRMLSVDFTQGANGDANNSPPLGDITWINGILNPNNSEYFEGVSTLQRVYFDAITPTSGNAHSMVFDHEAARGTTHAYDFLTSWQQALAATNAIAPGTLVDPNTDGPDANKIIEAVEPGSASPSNFTSATTALRSGSNFIDVVIPDMTDVGGANVQSRINAYEGYFGNRTLRIWGNAPFVGAGSMTFNGYTGNSDNQTAMYSLNWNSASTRILIEFGAHLAQGQDFTLTNLGYGGGNGAGSISGGPYHVSLLTLDGASLGSQDNQIQANAVSAPPDFTIDKTADALGKVTDPVDYTITIKNDGALPLYPQSIVDSLKGTLSAGSFTESGTNNDILDLGETWTLSYQRTVLSSDPDPLVNTVTAVFDTSSLLTGIELTHSASASTNLFQPAIDLTKTGDRSLAAVGDKITYTYTVTNSGSSDSPALVNVVLTDDNGTPNNTGDDLTPSFVGGDTDGDHKLDIGETWKYTASHTVTASDGSSITNTAKVTSSPDGFPNKITDSASLTVNIFTPSITIVKSGDALSKIGDPVHYTYAVTNTSAAGSPALVNVVVVDDNATPGNTADDFKPTFTGGDTDGDGKLDIGETWKYAATVTVPAGASDPYVNVATATATADGSVATASDTDSFSVNLFQPGITLDKTFDHGILQLGSVITYKVVITNTSSSDSPNLVPDTLVDTKTGPIPVGTFSESLIDDNVLEPGEVWTAYVNYTVQASDFPTMSETSTVTNTASAHFHPSGFPNDITATDTVTVTVTLPEKQGRMTGGGSIFLPDGAVGGAAGTRVTHGFQLHCTTDANNRLEINWGKPNNHFHLSQLTIVKCLDTPILQQPPDAPIDTLIGVGAGLFSGTVKGTKYSKAPATVQFIFRDAGEPGTSDLASYKITLADGTVVLNTDSSDADAIPDEIKLTKGNHQAHYEIASITNQTAQIQQQIDNTFSQLDNQNLTDDKIQSLTDQLLSLFQQYEASLLA